LSDSKGHISYQLSVISYQLSVQLTKKLIANIERRLG
jgi:hypothetical protein